MTGPVRWWERFLFGFARGSEDARDPRLRAWRWTVLASYVSLPFAAIFSRIDHTVCGVALAASVALVVAGWILYWRALR